MRETSLRNIAASTF